MARQVRSEATRRKILDAAIDVFGDVGYAAAAWGTIIERTGMTKGALYHHFDSKESLASAIIEEGSDTLLVAFRNVCGASSPALENMIHGTFTIANAVRSDKVARAAEQLTCALSGFNDAAAIFCASLMELMSAEAQRASEEGDLRPGLDPKMVGESVVGDMLGTRLLANAVRATGIDEDLIGRTGRMWELLLAGIVNETSLPYFRQFLAREALRHAQSQASLLPDGVMVPEVN
ncbi:TetR/AcrR family transcriptional regulator [Mycobacterium parmense]|uniref:TetR family transcriptional regulator n=1 Tax=Mycobacterium parmense TaxID=185642 RepID=A0A7I7Z3P1_9MYCO|nr:TetR/AcrR family transcriptional regulator [Mycobacterium parmense]MCV7352068.1 TetR/AcrR family transcriptional regulator [Mycobacterium parmense]ORW56079.1 spore coat protein CotS [Mycobacterium parmense]BBZ48217.1 TetR family transcriptional regulator [Mycobacterium parmense]